MAAFHFLFNGIVNHPLNCLFFGPNRPAPNQDPALRIREGLGVLVVLVSWFRHVRIIRLQIVGKSKVKKGETVRIALA